MRVMNLKIDGLAATCGSPSAVAVPGMHEFHDIVSALLRSVAAEVVLPRFRNLIAHDIFEKTPGEIVTIADHESEERLFAGLAALGTGARIIGEEACSENPALLQDLGSGQIWFIDPIDGTSNFAEGRSPFGMMVALVCDGVTQAGWLYDPITDRMCHAALGSGAFVNEVRVTIPTPRRPRPVAALATQFMCEADRQSVRARGEEAFELVPIPRCAAEHYPRLCLGENDVALFQRILPWDHAAGALLVTEAGGRVSRWDGSDYRIDDGKKGLLIAASNALWETAAAILFADVSAQHIVGTHLS